MTNNTFIVRTLLSLFICMIFATHSLANKDIVKSDNYILIINSYTEAAPWSIRLISAATEYVQSIPNLSLYTEHMSMLMVSNDSTLNEFKQSLFEKYKDYPPRFLILLGNSALILRDEYRKTWGDIPMIVCAENDYIGPNEHYLSKKPINVADRIPISDLAQPYNLVLLHSNLYISENVKLICQSVPKIEKFIFIGDGRQINQTNNVEIQAELKKHYPHIKYQFLSPQTITTNQLLDSLYNIDPQTTGILYSSWFYKHTFAGNTSLSTNSHQIIATASAPLFTIGMLTVKDAKNGMIGGYAYGQSDYNNKIIQTIKEILDGKQARDIPFYRPSDDKPIINYEVLLRKGLSLSNFPAETEFFNKPLTFWEQYNYFILGTIGCIVLLILFFQYRIHHINKLKKLQNKELEAMTTYRNLINNMPILYMQEEIVKNDSGKPIDFIYRNVNSHFEQKFFCKEEVTGKLASTIFPDSMPEFLHFTQMSLNENKAIVFPYYYKQIDKFFDIVLKAHTNNTIDVFCLDSTELHKAQQKLNATNNKLSMALEVASIVPWKWDLKSKTILCDINKPIELSKVGANINEEQLAVPDVQYFSKIFKEDRQRVEQAYKDLIEGRTNKVKEEYRIVSVQNHMHRIEWVEAQAAVETRDENGTPLTLVGSSLVITGRKKMEMELTTAKDRAEESNRLKSAFLANMSHEIRTPLNAIVGFSGILASTEEEQEKQEYVNIIENNNTLLLQLISDILDLSKIEAGTLEFQYSNIDLNKLMDELANSLRFKIKSENVLLNFTPTIESCFIHTEKNRLSQLLINLINNAIKFTTEGSINFGYELRDDKELYFYVSDTGCGIPKDKQKSIFGRFVKLNSFEQGTGLGLSICHTLVNHMGGTIGVNSEEGKGSTFWFTIPYKSVDAVDEYTNKVEIQPISIEKDKLTILIAEDNESNYKLFASILKGEYQLLHAWDGEEAIEMFKKYSPQIILMDINMPIKDGYEATKEIRKYSAKVPIIAVTAFAYVSDEQKVMESGFDAYMPKPINARLLKAQLKDIMQKRIVLL